MEYRCISADCHIDLGWMPYDLFVSNASQAMKDRMPYVVHGPNGPMWMTKTGLSLGLANGRLPRIKILGSGELAKKLVVSAHAFSASARTKIEAKGGTCEVIKRGRAVQAGA